MTLDFEHSDDSDVVNKAYVDENLLKINSNLSFLEKD